MFRKENILSVIKTPMGWTCYAKPEPSHKTDHGRERRRQETTGKTTIEVGRCDKKKCGNTERDQLTGLENKNGG